LRSLLRNLHHRDKKNTKLTNEAEDQLHRQVTAIYNLLANIYGTDKLVLKAGKLEALDGIKSTVIEDRVLALQKVVFEDPTIEKKPSIEEIPDILNEIEDELADLLARKTVEDRLERKISDRMQSRHEDYVKEIRMQIVKEETGPENAQTIAKLDNLVKLENRRLSRSILEVLRPTSLKEIVGQDAAITSLLTKIASPYPQHVILYGPPGVGKTTVARLVLEEAKKLAYSPFMQDAPFIEVDGATLRWDPREVTNPLLGSVHDPIYQGARKDLAEGGVPEPKLGLVSEANGGILFIDEIGELDLILQTKLLKVLEDKRVAFDSSYYDPEDPNVPKYIKQIFEEGAPADFILIGATTRDPSDISPAIRSRCAEVFFDPLVPADIKKIVEDAAKKLDVMLESNVSDIISDYTIEGRKAIGVLADNYGFALYRSQTNLEQPLMIRESDVYEVFRNSRMLPNVSQKASDSSVSGKIFGLGVSGYMGSVLEIEAVAFTAKERGKGTYRFNETAGSMAKDSVFNAASLIRRFTGEEIANYDIHVNIIGGGRIDGPSAGVAIFLAIFSAIKDIPLRQDIAVSGELSIQGKIKAVGGIYEKLYGAKQAGVRTVFIPRENANDVDIDVKGLEIIPVGDIEEILGWISQDEGRVIGLHEPEKVSDDQDDR